MWQTIRNSIWYYRTMFVALALILLFFRLLPLANGNDSFPWSAVPNWILGPFGVEPRPLAGP